MLALVTVTQAGPDVGDSGGRTLPRHGEDLKKRGKLEKVVNRNQRSKFVSAD